MNLRPLLCLCLGATLLACAKAPVVKPPAAVHRPVAAAPSEKPPATAPAPSEAEAAAAAALSPEPRVHFALDSSMLSEEAQQVLREWAALGRRAPRKVVIEGHTCELGTTEYNLALAHKRAETVRRYLTLSGLDPDQVELRALGEESPLDPGDGEDSHRKNRRAELRLAEEQP